MDNRLAFVSDYMEGAHPAILKRLAETNMEKTDGYGSDEYTAAAKEKIRLACDAPGAEIYFLVGGTQTNATVIDSVLRPYQGVLAPLTGHVSVHEAGAIEYGGHKVLGLPHKDGKITAEQVEEYINGYEADANREHMVMPGMVYISHPTEYGTLYTKEELTKISTVCRSHQIPLYVDGARLAYALACPANDITLKDMAKLCDIFYIGGTKCGALFGEAVVIPKSGMIPHFFSMIKQHGALFAKGRILGLQFDTMFTDGLYEKIGAPAISGADMIRAMLKAKGYRLFNDAPTNQVLFYVDDEQMEELGRNVRFDFWEKADETHTVIRLATSWATKEEDVRKLEEYL